MPNVQEIASLKITLFFCFILCGKLYFYPALPESLHCSPLNSLMPEVEDIQRKKERKIFFSKWFEINKAKLMYELFIVKTISYIFKNGPDFVQGIASR